VLVLRRNAPVLEPLIAEFRKLGGEAEVFEDTGTAHLAIESNRVLSGREVEGLSVKTKERDEGVDLDVELAPGCVIEKPVHMCFGVMKDKGVQRLNIKVTLREDASAEFIAHCMFPSARKVLHEMDAEVLLARGASMKYNEVHFHGIHGGVEVKARARVEAGPRARYSADFSLLNGLVGKLGLDYSVKADRYSVVELTARVFGHERDLIDINEAVVLDGEGARSIIKTRVALEGEARAEVRGMTEGRAPHARGHVDCTEILKDSAMAYAVPVVSVTNPMAKVTHEAAIGSVDKAQMETLCARGLTPEEAVDVIVKGLLG
jgi:Fe-S cluster assembly scaffold protein SufB